MDFDESINLRLDLSRLTFCSQTVGIVCCDIIKMSLQGDLNSQPLTYKESALTTKLWRHNGQEKSV